MIERVKKYIRENQMLEAGSMIVAGVSGGADSVAMLHILKSIQKEFRFSLEAVHIHHGIRGKEADRDEALVKKICEEWKIPFQSYHYPVPRLSREWKLGEEETGRIVRKQAFAEEKRSLVFRKNGKREWGGSALRWPITVMIWQKPCYIIWHEGQAFAAFREFAPVMEKLSGRFYV